MGMDVIDRGLGLGQVSSSNIDGSVLGIEDPGNLLSDASIGTSDEADLWRNVLEHVPRVQGCGGTRESHLASEIRYISLGKRRLRRESLIQGATSASNHCFLSKR